MGAPQQPPSSDASPSGSPSPALKPQHTVSPDGPTKPGTTGGRATPPQQQQQQSKAQHDRFAAAPKTYAVGPLLTYVKYYVTKVENVQALVEYTLLMALVLALIFTGTHSSVSPTIASAVAQQQLASDTFTENVAQAGDWYGWFTSVLDAHHAAKRATAVASSSVHDVVGGFVIAAYRVKPRLCHGSDGGGGDREHDDGVAQMLRRVNLAFRQHPPACFATPWGAGAAEEALRPRAAVSAGVYNSTAFAETRGVAWSGGGAPDATATPPVVAAVDVNARGLCAPVEVQGLDAVYHCDDAASVLFVDITDIGNVTTYTRLTAAVAELARGRWADASSVRAVDTAAVVLDRWLQRFHRVSATMEVGDMFGASPLMSTMTFAVPQLRTASAASPHDYARFVLAILTLLWTLRCCFMLVHRIAIQIELNSRLSNALDLHFVLDLAVIAMVLTIVARRFILLDWCDRAFPLDSATSHRDTVLHLLYVGGTLEAATTLEAWALLVVLFRVLYSLRYVARFSLVFETVAASVTDMLSMLPITAFIVMPYALAGCILWHNTPTPFRSVGRAVMMLINVMISLNVDHYKTYEAEYLISTTVFFVTFFLVSWCLLMNVVVGVLATAFAAASTTQIFVRRPVWSVEAVLRDIVSLWRRVSSVDEAEVALARQREKRLLARVSSGIVDDETSKAPDAAPVADDTAAYDDEDGTLPWPLPPRAQRPKHNRLLQITLLGGELRPNVLRAVLFIEELRVLKSQDGNDAQITVAAAAKLSLFSAVTTQRMLTKSELHVGVSDANRRRWLMMQKLIKGEKDVSAQLTIQYRQLQELVETVCGGEMGNEGDDDGDEGDAGGATSAAAAALGRDDSDNDGGSDAGSDTSSSYFDGAELFGDGHDEGSPFFSLFDDGDGETEAPDGASDATEAPADATADDANDETLGTLGTDDATADGADAESAVDSASGRDGGPRRSQSRHARRSNPAQTPRTGGLDPAADGAQHQQQQHGARAAADTKDEKERLERQQRRHQRAVMAETLSATQSLVSRVQAACVGADARRRAMARIDVQALAQLVADYERLALSMGVVV